MKQRTSDQKFLRNSLNNWTLSKLTLGFIFLLSLPSIILALRFFLCVSSDSLSPSSKANFKIQSYSSGSSQTSQKTKLNHIFFGIAASAELWNKRKSFVKLWWRPGEMNGVVWLDRALQDNAGDGRPLPPVKVSSNTSNFRYTNKRGHASAIRISRIVLETFRMVEKMGKDDVRWFVMCDDDTVFVPDNLVRVLSKYDHDQFYYIGSSSESHLQNIKFSYGMAYGGAGFAISYPLAKSLEKVLDSCIERYPSLYGSDDRIHACMTELGVPLTKEAGFHQFDVYGSVFGLLAAHPVAPVVSLHHLDLVDPLFPNTSRVHALRRLKVAMDVDSAGLLQQSICYDRARAWTVSVSWGYAVQIIRATVSAREMETPAKTFLNWYKRDDRRGYSFNTRPLSRNPCQKPYVYYMRDAFHDRAKKKTISVYVRDGAADPDCEWKIADPAGIHMVEVYKESDPHFWDKAPRRNCCRVIPSKKEGRMVIGVGACGEDEIVEMHSQQ